MKAEVEFRCAECFCVVEVYSNQNARPHEGHFLGLTCRGAGRRAWSQIMAIEGAQEEPGEAAVADGYAPICTCPPPDEIEGRPTVRYLDPYCPTHRL